MRISDWSSDVCSSDLVSALRDDEGSWEGAQGKLWLDGFTYLRFDGHAPTDARTRIAWLSKHVPEHVGKDFRTQPWEQPTMVLRAMGHSTAARKVAIQKQEQFPASGQVPPITNDKPRMSDRVGPQ